MRKKFLAPALALFIAFALVSTPSVPFKAMAVESCLPGNKQTGFLVGAHTWGSAVTLCARFVADQTKLKTSKRAVGDAKKPSALKPNQPKGADKPMSPRQRQKLLHRRMARSGANSFTPTPLIILASHYTVKLKTDVALTLQHPRQFRTAYLLSRFVSLRFTPVKTEFHFDSKTRLSAGSRAPFGSSVRFLSLGWHVIRGIVTYRAEFRVNGEKLWRLVIGAPTLAAVPARVLVVKDSGSQAPAQGLHRRPYLVYKDCTLQLENVGCLN